MSAGASPSRSRDIRSSALVRPPRVADVPARALGELVAPAVGSVLLLGLQPAARARSDPVASAVLNQTWPEPCQCRPTMLKRSGAERGADARTAASGTSRAITRTSCAAAVPGAITASAATSIERATRTLHGRRRLPSYRIRGLLRPQGHRHDPDRIFTPKVPRLRGLFCTLALLGQCSRWQEAQLPRSRLRACSQWCSRTTSTRSRRTT